jgi:hypothetical protein
MRGRETAHLLTIKIAVRTLSTPFYQIVDVAVSISDELLRENCLLLDMSRNTTEDPEIYRLRSAGFGILTIERAKQTEVVGQSAADDLALYDQPQLTNQLMEDDSDVTHTLDQIRHASESLLELSKK